MGATRKAFVCDRPVAVKILENLTLLHFATAASGANLRAKNKSTLCSTTTHRPANARSLSSAHEKNVSVSRAARTQTRSTTAQIMPRCHAAHAGRSACTCAPHLRSCSVDRSPLPTSRSAHVDRHHKGAARIAGKCYDLRRFGYGGGSGSIAAHSRPEQPRASACRQVRAGCAHR